MGTVIWEGGSTAIAQVDTITIALTWATNDTATLTIGTRSLVLTVGTDSTTANVATAIKEMWNGDAQTGSGDHVFSETGNDITEFNEITATVNSSVVTLTSDTTGVPFTVTVTGDGTAGDGTAVVAASTVNAGPNVWDTATNWDTGAVPVGADDVVIENSSVSILYGIDQNAVTLTSLTKKSTFTAPIGLPRNNTAGYVEYRPTYLAISATTVNSGQGTGTDSGRFKLDVGSNITTLNIYKTGTRAETGIPAFLFKGTHVDNDITVNRGDMGIAFFGGETANFQTMRIGWINSILGDADIIIGPGVTHKAAGIITQTGGQLESRSNVITALVSAGEFTLSEDSTITTMTLQGGTLFYNSSGTATTINVTAGGVLDFRQDARGRTITQLNLNEGASVFDPGQTATLTANGVDLVQCGWHNISSDFGENRTWTPSAI